MSSSYSQLNERRLSANGKNIYISLSSPTINTYDPQKNKNYLTLKPTTKESSPLSSENISAPIIEDISTKENKKKEVIMGDKKSNAVTSSSINNINPMNAGEKDKSPLLFNSDSPPQLIIKNTGAIPKNKNLEGNVKILTGMDRYITITKRKSSPRNLRLEPNPKQPKPNPVSQNRFSILDNQESENVSKPPKAQKPPPLYLRECTTNDLVSKLSQLLGKENFYVVSLRKGNVAETKIQTYTEKHYRILVENFDNEKKNYYTYQLKSAKGLVFVIKGIDSTVPVDDIKEALKSLGYEVKSVHNVINKNRIPQPMFKVEIAYDSSHLKKKGDTHPIYELRFLLNRRITVEEPLKRKGPPQCLNCQEFGHTKSFCKLPTVCVRCGDIHKSLECPYSKTEGSYRKCSNCGQNHTANYRGCPVYRQLLEKSKLKRPTYRLYQDSHYPSLPSNYTSSTQYGSKLNKNDPQLSYAHAVSKNNSNVLVGAKGTIKEASVIPTQPMKKGSVAQKANVENKSLLLSYAHALKQGAAIPHKIIENNAPLFSYSNIEGSENPRVDTQGPIEKLIETMNNFMTNMQSMFQQLMQNQSMLMQIMLTKK